MCIVFALQIMNPNPFPGLVLSPVCGVVPVGGVTLISATLTPDAIIKFDTQVTVAVRSGKPVELRVSGTVEPPVVDIDLVSDVLSQWIVVVTIDSSGSGLKLNLSLN